MGRKIAGGLRQGRLRIRARGVRSAGRHLAFDTLHSTARMAIGLVQSTEYEHDEVAEVMGVEPDEFAEFWKSLLTDDATAKIIEDGLPGIYGEALPPGRSVRCIYCRREVVHVPCVKCWPDHGRSDFTKARHREDMPEDPIGCDLKPGPSKVETMRRRVDLGMSPFSSRDRWFYDEEDDTVSGYVDPEPEPTEEDVLFEAFLARIKNK
jgi:hypothetical protein